MVSVQSRVCSLLLGLQPHHASFLLQTLSPPPGRRNPVERPLSQRALVWASILLFLSGQRLTPSQWPRCMPWGAARIPSSLFRPFPPRKTRRCGPCRAIRHCWNCGPSLGGKPSESISFTCGMFRGAVSVLFAESTESTHLVAPRISLRTWHRMAGSRYTEDKAPSSWLVSAHLYIDTCKASVPEHKSRHARSPSPPFTNPSLPGPRDSHRPRSEHPGSICRQRIKEHPSYPRVIIAS